MRAQFEPGLPGTGPFPVHMHQGHPTPWSEGVVVRVFPDRAHEWIANLQGSHGYATKIVSWPRAGAIWVVINGGVYLLYAEEPARWRYYADLGIDCRVLNDHELALLTTYYDLIAIRPSGEIAWARSLAIDGVEIVEVRDGKIIGLACVDPPDDWKEFTLRISDGTDA